MYCTSSALEIRKSIELWQFIILESFHLAPDIVLVNFCFFISTVQIMFKYYNCEDCVKPSWRRNESVQSCNIHRSAYCNRNTSVVGIATWIILVFQLPNSQILGWINTPFMSFLWVLSHSLLPHNSSLIFVWLRQKLEVPYTCTLYNFTSSTRTKKTMIINWEKKNRTLGAHLAKMMVILMGNFL